MNLDHIASYLAVIGTGSFHAAARERGLSQASVSQHIRMLEEAQQTALVVRDRAGCRPVPGTEQFAYYAELLVDLAERTGRVLSRPRLVIGAASNIGTYLIQPVFKRFVEEYAGHLDADLVIGANGTIAERLEAGGIDVALMEWWEDRPGFEATAWTDEELVVIVGPGHAWRDRRTVAPADLAGQPILGGEPQTGTGTLLRQRLGAAADKLRVTMNLGSTEAVKQAVRNDLGISLVLAGAVQDELRTGSLHALRIEQARLRKPLWAIIRRDLPSSSPARQFIDMLAASPTPGVPAKAEQA
ncbi:LysR family transcriptional regulator [Actinomadura fulvescens]|uniref:LysR family transcriptional regulator n=1 Tax=Actinomadura fulvescens TaxID=46160 RepID=A0ABN3PNM0_9ACTN